MKNKTKSNLKRALVLALASPFIAWEIGSIPVGAGCGITGLVQRQQALDDFSNTSEYKIYRQLEDERLEELYDSTVSVAEKQYENGEITEKQLKDTKTAYIREEAQSHDVYQSLLKLNNEEYMKRVKDAERLATVGAVFAAPLAMHLLAFPLALAAGDPSVCLVVPNGLIAGGIASLVDKIIPDPAEEETWGFLTKKKNHQGKKEKARVK